MDFTLALYLLLVAGLILLLALVSPALTPAVGERGYKWERRCSWLLVTAYLGVNILRLQSRAMDALATQGLSTQNKFQVVLVGMAALWCGYLVLARRVTVRQIISGPGFWLLCLVAIFALSVLWSTWPTLTVFRVAELAVFWIVACHVFGTGDWFRQFESLMWVAWLMYATWGALLIAGVVEGVTSGGYIVGIVTSNSASLLTGLLLLWILHRSVAESSLLHAWKLPILALSLIMFGSLATTAFVLICIAIMLTMYSRGHLRFVMVFCTLCLIATATNVVVLQSGEPGTVFLDTTSTLSGKSRSNIVAMTGRLELWTTIWESARHQPWGFGFAAFERTLSLSNSSMSWKAGNAHNGFISAWLGAGWLAVALLLSYLASVWAKQQTIDVTQRPVFLTLLLLIVLNNLTVPAVGGRLTVEFLVLMALSHIPVARRFDTPELRPYARA
jgi:hypothetical protein